MHCKGNNGTELARDCSQRVYVRASSPTCVIGTCGRRQLNARRRDARDAAGSCLESHFHTLLATVTMVSSLCETTTSLRSTLVMGG